MLYKLKVAALKSKFFQQSSGRLKGLAGRTKRVCKFDEIPTHAEIINKFVVGKSFADSRGDFHIHPLKIRNSRRSAVREQERVLKRSFPSKGRWRSCRRYTIRPSLQRRGADHQPPRMT